MTLKVEEIKGFVFCPYYKKKINSYYMCWEYNKVLLKKCILFKGINEITGENPKRFMLCEFKEKK